MIKKQTQPDPSSMDSELITDQASIVRIFKQLVKRNMPLTVKIGNQKALYTSYTVSVDTPFILLDELIPPSGNQILQEEGNISVTCKLDGVDIQFSTSLERVDEADKLLTYYMHLPDQIEYMQRRQDYRVNIPISKQLQVYLLDSNNQLCEGYLHDISHSGAGVVLPDSIKFEIKQLYGCAIQLNDEDWLYCTIEIRYSKTIQPKGRQLTGTKFQNLAMPQPRLLRRSIS